jgi:hypothetical protein
MLRHAGFDAGVHYLSIAALTLWHIGYPEEALRRSNEALVLAQELSHPYSLVYADFAMGLLRQFRREASGIRMPSRL